MDTEYGHLRNEVDAEPETNTPLPKQSYEFLQPYYTPNTAHGRPASVGSNLDYQPPDSATNDEHYGAEPTNRDSFASLLPSDDALTPESQKPVRGLQFWMCIVSIMLSSFIMSLDLAGIATALPTIIGDLGGGQFEWVGSAYALSATALLPLSGALAQAFGRRPSMLVQLLFFAVGSAMCGAAGSVNFLIAGRTVQGIGGGGIAATSQIVISDLVPLHERGTFNAILALAYALSTGIAALVAGSLAQSGQWRWFFYLNLPICAVSAILTAVFFNFNTPRGSIRDKLMTLDWIGNGIVVLSTTAVIFALTIGGIEHPWGSVQVLLPLILGSLGLVAFVIYDSKVPRVPLVPVKVMSSLEAVSGYLQGFFTNFFMMGLFYYLPVYFQACKDASPIRSGVLVLATTLTTMPVGVISGVSVAKTGRYRPQLWLAWASLILGAGLFSTLHADSPLSASIGFQIFTSIGIGILLTCSFFPILAPIPLSMNANALAFFMFTRFFAQSWGISVGGAVLQNALLSRIPADAAAHLPNGLTAASVGFTIVPMISTMPEPLKSEIQNAFGESIRMVWQVLIGVAACGFLASLLMRGLDLRKESEEYWGKLEERLRRNLGIVGDEREHEHELGLARKTNA